jgi:hypothetical protein
MDSTATMTPETPTTVETPETPAQRRHRMRIEASARAASLHSLTRIQANTDKATRAADGFTGREGYTAWQALVRDEIRDALDGETVALLLSRVETKATKRGVSYRCTVTGAATVAGHDVAITGEASVRDVVDARTLDGATVHVKLVARRGTHKDGSPFTGFQGESVGVASTGQRIGIKCQVRASRHVRVAASAL